MDEKDLQNINQIDMECNVYDDDDSFGLSDSSNLESIDDRPLQSKTGIIIKFDDDEDYRPAKKITANVNSKNKNIDIHSDFSSSEFHDFNEIDLETPYSEDDDEIKINSKDENPLFFDSENELSGLIDNDILEESKSKKKISFGEVEDDYWDKLSKKHAKTNKKGAYNTSFHFAGNPKKEQDIFNHMMGTDSGDVDVGELLGSDSLISAGVSSGGEVASAGIDTGGAGDAAGCSESLTSTTNYGSKLLNLFDMIGFEIFKNSDGSYTAIDTCDVLPYVECSDINDLVITLKPYIDDFIISPLQLSTGQKFDNYNDWVKWYNESNKAKFSKCAQDIEFCDLLANHLKECIID